MCYESLPKAAEADQLSGDLLKGFECVLDSQTIVG
jgi:hypothetical protein